MRRSCLTHAWSVAILARLPHCVNAKPCKIGQRWHPPARLSTAETGQRTAGTSNAETQRPRRNAEKPCFAFLRGLCVSALKVGASRCRPTSERGRRVWDILGLSAIARHPEARARPVASVVPACCFEDLSKLVRSSFEEIGPFLLICTSGWRTTALTCSYRLGPSSVSGRMRTKMRLAANCKPCSLMYSLCFAKYSLVISLRRPCGARSQPTRGQLLAFFSPRLHGSEAQTVRGASSPPRHALPFTSP